MAWERLKNWQRVFGALWTKFSRRSTRIDRSFPSATKRNTLNGSHIKRVTIQGITYLAKDGREKFVDFSACYLNYVKFSLSPRALVGLKKGNNYSDEQMVEAIEGIKARKCIGVRDSWNDGNQPLIEFYSNPRIRFEFNDIYEYREICHALEDAGWDTWDFS